MVECNILLNFLLPPSCWGSAQFSPLIRTKESFGAQIDACQVAIATGGSWHGNNALLFIGDPAVYTHGLKHNKNELLLYTPFTRELVLSPWHLFGLGAIIESFQLSARGSIDQGARQVRSEYHGVKGIQHRNKPLYPPNPWQPSGTLTPQVGETGD